MQPPPLHLLKMHHPIHSIHLPAILPLLPLDQYHRHRTGHRGTLPPLYPALTLPIRPPRKSLCLSNHRSPRTHFRKSVLHRHDGHGMKTPRGDIDDASSDALRQETFDYPRFERGGQFGPVSQLTEVSRSPGEEYAGSRSVVVGGTLREG